MDEIIRKIAEVTGRYPHKPALVSELGPVTYRALLKRTQRLAAWLQKRGFRRVALYRENSAEWIVIDLACAIAGVTLVPLPTFFSERQIGHVIRGSGPELIFIDDEARALRLGLTVSDDTPVLENTYAVIPATEPRKRAVTGDIAPAKITFTSGTTGEPKGVCLAPEAIDRVALSLLHEMEHLSVHRHMTLLPLSTLLENIAGVYVPLMMGSCIHVFRGKSIGLPGSSALQPATLLARLNDTAPDSLILVPQMLKALVDGVAAGLAGKLNARFIAVGGGKVSPSLIRNARGHGLPVFEGYGLTECASVVSLNTPSAERPGSVGKPLKHVRVRIDNGKVLVNTGFSAAYIDMNDKPASLLPNGNDAWIDTGDLGYLDDEGFLYITGRAGSIIINNYGRNISPEWVESELLQFPALLQCAVFGDAQPFCAAVLVANTAFRPTDIAEAIERVNRDLPDYARIRSWILADEPFSVGNGLLTANGRPRRRAIERHYRRQLDSIYGATRLSKGVST